MEACQGVSGVQVKVISDVKVLEKEYPLLMAVARASLPVERHRPCVVRLEYQRCVLYSLYLRYMLCSFESTGAARCA